MHGYGVCSAYSVHTHTHSHTHSRPVPQGARDLDCLSLKLDNHHLGTNTIEIITHFSVRDVILILLCPSFRLVQPICFQMESDLIPACIRSRAKALTTECVLCDACPEFVCVSWSFHLALMRFGLCPKQSENKDQTTVFPLPSAKSVCQLSLLIQWLLKSVSFRLYFKTNSSNVTFKQRAGR